VNATALARGFHRRTGGINVLVHATRKAGDLRVLDLLGDGLYRGEVTIANHGEARLYDVHFQAAQLPRHRELFAEVHRSPWALLAIAQRGVENQNSVFAHSLSFAEMCLPKNRADCQSRYAMRRRLNVVPLARYAAPPHGNGSTKTLGAL